MSAFWVSALADTAVRAAALLTVAAAITVLPRYRSAAVRHFVWAFAIAGVLVLPLAGAVMPRVQVPMPWMLVEAPAPFVADRPAGPETTAAPATVSEGADMLRRRRTHPSPGDRCCWRSGPPAPWRSPRGHWPASGTRAG